MRQRPGRVKTPVFCTSAVPVSARPLRALGAADFFISQLFAGGLNPNTLGHDGTIHNLSLGNQREREAGQTGDVMCPEGQKVP
mmetsp:Transcript_87142/g.269805  ORF Transcript_87142/g.269805 Transcript_87142/m.269805 type:complete len:83 (+) Transcript_87142:3-251(+)